MSVWVSCEDFAGREPRDECLSADAIAGTPRERERRVCACVLFDQSDEL